MCAGKDDHSDVVDREPDQEKSLDPSGPRIRCPLCGWSPRKEDHWFCECGHSWNTFDTGGVCPACLQQWTENPVPLVQSMVTALRLVYELTKKLWVKITIQWLIPNFGEASLFNFRE